MVQEFRLTGSRWLLHKQHDAIGHANNVAPANLRAAAENSAYRSLVNTWIDENYKLRYSGGMVPDVHHILAKVGGDAVQVSAGRH